MPKYVYTPRAGGCLYGVEPPPMLIDPFLPAATLGGLSGGPGVGKTWLALEASRALTTGTPFLGRFPVHTKGAVLLIGSDSSEFDYARCWRRLTEKQYEELGGEQPDCVPDTGDSIEDINPLNDCFRHLIVSDFSLDDPDKVDAMIRAANFEWGPFEWEDDDAVEDDDGIPHHVPGGWRRQRGAGLIIMDTFGSLTEKDLIDNTEMIAVYKGLRKFVTETGATVLLLNHNPHRRDTWLGAISQVGKLDFWLHLRRPHKWDETFIQVVFKKVRGIKPNYSVYYRMNVEDPDEASLISEGDTLGGTPATATPAVEGDADRALILEQLRDGEKRMKEFVGAKQLSPDPASTPEAARKALGRKLTQMVTSNEIEVETTPGKPSVWRLPSASGISVEVDTK